MQGVVNLAVCVCNNYDNLKHVDFRGKKTWAIAKLEGSGASSSELNLAHLFGNSLKSEEAPNFQKVNSECRGPRYSFSNKSPWVSKLCACQRSTTLAEPSLSLFLALPPPGRHDTVELEHAPSSQTSILGKLHCIELAIVEANVTQNPLDRLHGTPSAQNTPDPADVQADTSLGAWESKVFCADVLDPKARTSMTREGLRKTSWRKTSG